MSVPTLARLGDPNRHFWLTRSVGRVMGLSLGQAVLDGRLSEQSYCGMVTRCRRCLQVDSCERWLGAQPVPPTSAPDFCPNSEIYNRLKQGGAPDDTPPAGTPASDTAR